jgi:hypothetical protein
MPDRDPSVSQIVRVVVRHLRERDLGPFRYHASDVIPVEPQLIRTVRAPTRLLHERLSDGSDLARISHASLCSPALAIPKFRELLAYALVR